MNITAKHYKKILSLIERMHEHTNEAEMRADIAMPVLELLDADYFASFCWDQATSQYDQGIYLNMDDGNIDKYCHYFQFRDPITFRLAQKRMATAVSEIMPHEDLRKTEFFNDFLLVDGLYHGVNLHLYHHQENIGDLRIWRKRGRGDFDTASCDMLDMLKPHLIQAIKNIRRLSRQHIQSPVSAFDDHYARLKVTYQLTNREMDVARLLFNGDSDHTIASTLNIGITTVRTHVKNIFKKMGINSRNKLQNLVWAEDDPMPFGHKAS